MSRRLCMVILVLSLFVSGMLAECRAQDQEAADGRITKVKCSPAQFKRGDKKPRPLTKQDEGLRLKAHDEVQCLGPDFIELLLPSGPKQIKVEDGLIVIPPIDQDPLYAKSIADALTGYGLRGATRGRAADSRIFWPSDNSAVVPDHFEIRWAPVAQKIELSILSEAKDFTLWGPAELDGKAGSLKSDAIASALAAYKAKAANPALVLTLTLANSSDWEEVHFSLLNARQEQELTAQLDYWEKHTDGLALRLGRAYSYSRYKLFADAAEEYESALSSAPESRYLLEDAIQANRLAGRPSRVKELQARLASQP